MPQLGETVADGTVTKWFKKVGDAVTRGEPLFEVSTDKVDTEIPAQADGVLSEILVTEDTTVDVGTKLAVIGGSGDDAPPVESAAFASEPAAASASAFSPPIMASAGAGERLSPVVRRLLAEKGLDASDVTGTGHGGRATKAAVPPAAASAASAAVPTSASVAAASVAQLSPVV